MPRTLHTGLQTYGLIVLAALGIAVASPVDGAPAIDPAPWTEAITHLAPQLDGLQRCYRDALGEISHAAATPEIDLQITITDGRGRVSLAQHTGPDTLSDCVLQASASWDYAGLSDTTFVWPVRLAWVD